MDPRRLRYLLELSRRGSMRAVAEALHTTTSTVSQQIAVLAGEVGAELLEPEGRRVRLTPAGRRLADHAVTILTAIDTARRDLDPAAAPAGTVRVAGFATATRRSLLPVVARLCETHSAVRLRVREHECAEALELLLADEVDLALTYDYTLAPAALPAGLTAVPLWSTPWGLAVPDRPDAGGPADSVAVFRAHADRAWIGNSRNPADEDVLRMLGSLAGFRPDIGHRADSLELVEDLILAGQGVGLLPAGRPGRAGVRVLPLPDPELRLRCYAVTRVGHAAWPALALVLDRLAAGADGPDTR